MAAVSDNSASSLNMQFEDHAEKLFQHNVVATKEMQIFNLQERRLRGSTYRVDFQTAGNTYMGARARGAYTPGYNPSASAQDGFAPFTVEQMNFTKRFCYISFDFTGQMEAAVNAGQGGYENLLTFREKDTMDHMNERVGIKLAGTQLGTIGKVQDVSGATITLRYAGHNSPEAGMRYVKPGLRLDAATASRTGALRAGANDRGRNVISVQTDEGSDATGPTLELQSATTSWAAGDYVVTYDERQAAAISSSADWSGGLYNPLGLMDAIDDGDFSAYYGGLARASYPTLKAVVLDNGGTKRDLTRVLINQAIDKRNALAGEQSPIDLLYCTPGVVRKFLDSGVNLQGGSSTTERFNDVGGKEVKIGVNKFKVYPLGMTGELMFMPSRLAPHHSAFLISRSSAILLMDGKPQFMKQKDGTVVQKVTGRDEYTADLKWYVSGIVCRRPQDNIRIDDLNGSHMEA